MKFTKILKTADRFYKSYGIVIVTVFKTLFFKPTRNLCEILCFLLNFTLPFFFVFCLIFVQYTAAL